MLIEIFLGFNYKILYMISFYMTKLYIMKNFILIITISFYYIVLISDDKLIYFILRIWIIWILKPIVLVDLFKKNLIKEIILIKYY